MSTFLAATPVSKSQSATDSRAGPSEDVEVGLCEWDIQSDAWIWEAPLFDVFGVSADRVSPSSTAPMSMKHPDDLQATVAVMQALREGSDRFSYLNRIFREDGKVRELVASGRVGFSSAGLPRILHATIVARTEWFSPLEPRDLGGASDGSLMLGLLAKMPEAYTEIYRRHSRSVIGIAHHYFRSALAADDVVQDVFEKLCRAPERFDARRGSLGKYLEMQTRSRCIDLLRSQASTRRRELSYEPPKLSLDPDDEVTSADRIRSALSLLPPDERAAIELAFMHGHTYRVVAEHLHIPEGTAKARIRKGLQRLRASNLFAID